jgi:hypothetical protein
MLARIREIRASEKRFYQKVRELFALSTDYDPSDRTIQQFFAAAQNALLFAVTRQTAAELVHARANPDDPNFGLLAWKGNHVRKTDILRVAQLSTRCDSNNITLRTQSASCLHRHADPLMLVKQHTRKSEPRGSIRHDHTTASKIRLRRHRQLSY